MASKLKECTISVHGVGHTFLLDDRDIDRHRALGLLLHEGPATQIDPPTPATAPAKGKAPAKAVADEN